MAKRQEVNIRFGVGLADGPRSSIWRGYSRNDEVYLSHSNMGGIQKFSFHSSGICRWAFTREEGPGEGEDDRVIERWKRFSAYPGSGYALLIRFPTDFLSTALSPERKMVQWIPAAKSGGSTTLEFIFSSRSERAAADGAVAAGRTVLSQTVLPNGELFSVTWLHEPWFGESFKMPGVLHDDKEYVVSEHDPNNTGRPARVTRLILKEGVPAIAEEFGAYQMPLDSQVVKTAGVLTRTKILKRRGAQGLDAKGQYLESSAVTPIRVK